MQEPYAIRNAKTLIEPFNRWHKIKGSNDCIYYTWCDLGFDRHNVNMQFVYDSDNLKDSDNKCRSFSCFGAD